MKLKKLNAVLGLLSILSLLVHVGYTIYTYIAFYYNPVISRATQLPLVLLVLTHAVCGMLILFLYNDGSQPTLYPKQNRRTIIQRVSAALILPVLFVHFDTFKTMQSSAEAGNTTPVYLLMVIETLFFAIVIAHVSTSLTNAFITLGILSSRETQKKINRAVYVIGAAVFLFAVFAVVRTQAAMFLMG